MPFRGRHTKETKARISAALKGIPRPPAVRAAIAAGKLGKKADVDHRLAIRIGHRRIKLFEPARYAAKCASRSEIMRAAWMAGRFANRKPRRVSTTPSKQKDAA